jgi:glycosyltransferase involved in cell wall biosynthesis
MRIGIDARELCGRPTGVGRYLAGLLAEWAVDERARRHEFVLYAPAPIALSLDARRFPTRAVHGHPGSWWEQVRLPRAAASDHLEAWFAPGYTAPLRLKIPTVVAIHDLSFVAHPEWFRFREGLRRRWVTRQSAAAATAIITISDFSKGELVERLNVPEAKIHVIPPGVPASSQKPSRLRSHADRASSGEARQRADGATAAAISPPNVLFVGSIFNRRHVSDLIRAFAPIARARPHTALDIVGDNRTYPHEDLRRTIESEGLQSIAQWHEYVSDEQLHELYARAGAFAFLSEYEGLGLTPLEALAAGVPAVLLDTAVARESCGDAALYVPVSHLPATTRALETLLFDQPARARLLAAAPAVLGRYSWPRAARETLALLEEACGHS